MIALQQKPLPQGHITPPGEQVNSKPRTEATTQAPSLIVKLKTPERLARKLVVQRKYTSKRQYSSYPSTSSRLKLDMSEKKVSKHKVPKENDYYVNSLLRHQRRAREERSTMSQRVKDLKKSLQQYEKSNVILGGQIWKLRQEIKTLEATCKARGNAIRDYARAAEACKPIILEAIEEKLNSEAMDGGGQGLQANTLLTTKERAKAEYEKHFCAAEIELSDDAE